MKIAFRVDASVLMGSGHVIRCLTLGAALQKLGHQVIFVCRPHRGHLMDLVTSKGFSVLSLPAVQAAESTEGEYGVWLGVSQQRDAAETVAAIAENPPHLLIVDHYGLGRGWETALRPHVHTIMVVDDLANRKHQCDLLLDQNLTKAFDRRYDRLVPAGCRMLLGPAFALVRSAFVQWRPYSLRRRTSASLERVIIFMGGSDLENDTLKALNGVLACKRDWQHIDIVVGGTYRYRADLDLCMAALPHAQLHINTSHMAELMANADVAITAGGSINWEKCTLGLPSVVAIQADNQEPIVRALSAAGAVVEVGQTSSITPKNYAQAIADLSPDGLMSMSKAAANVCNGSGTELVVEAISRRMLELASERGNMRNSQSVVG